MDKNTIYTTPEAVVKNNGWFSESFSMSRGIRQGCPVSALLFILCVEILGIYVRNSKSLRGFNFGKADNIIKISQYADDTVIFLNNNNELCLVLNIMNSFGNMSGLKQ